MPGPFPGMDPYLEDPALWPGLHDGLIYTLSAELNANLPEGYYSRRQLRLYVIQEDRDILPDVIVSQEGTGNSSPVGRRGSAGLTLERSAPVLLRVEQEEVSEAFIEIQHTSVPDRVVTVIEILSCSNKAPGTAGNQEYRRKQREVLRSDINLIEIDLLRRGAHTAAPPHDSIVRQFGHWHYLVSLNRHLDRSEYELWLLSIRQRLPEIHVPLLDGEPEVSLDLQAAFDRCYDEDHYDLDPYFPLPDADAAWADSFLREKGFRT